MKFEASAPIQIPSTGMKAKYKGALAEIKAQTWLMECGYEVFVNVSPHGAADLLIRNPDTGEIHRIDVTTGNWVPLSGGKRKLATKSLTTADVKYLVYEPTEDKFYWDHELLNLRA